MTDAITTAVLQNRLNAIAEDRRADGDFEEGWRVSEVLDAVEQSAAERRWIDVPGSSYHVMDEPSGGR